MLATMDANGVITLTPETSVEAFALQQWIGLAEETTYGDEPGALTRKPQLSWSQSRLVVHGDVPKGGAA